MEDYTLSLALFDFLPVIVAAIGFFMICRYCAIVGHSTGAWVIAIPLLAVTGGFLKASWKTIVAVTGINIQWMSDQLFFFLASSYVLMATLVIRSLAAEKKGRPLRDNWWHIPAVGAAAIVATALLLKQSYEERYWSFLLLGVLSICNLVFAVRLIAHSFVRRNWLSGSLFVVNLLVAYTLVGLARIPEQTVRLQWYEQTLNLLATTAFAVAAWHLLKRANAREFR